MRRYMNIVENALTEWDEDETEDEATPALELISAFRAAHSDPTCEVTLRETGAAEVELYQITVAPDSRGTGQASAAMKLLTELADRYRVWLTLEPAANMGGGLSTDDLRRWYARWGFEGDGTMDRRPA